MVHKWNKNLVLIKSKRIRALGGVAFVATVAFSLMASIWAIYLRELFGSDAKVGLVASFFIGISFLSYFVIIPIIERYDKYRIAKLANLLVATGFIGYYFIDDSLIFLLFGSLMAFLGTLRISSMGLLIKNNSSRKYLSKNEGLMYTLFNTSFLIGPLLASLIISRYGLKPVFLFSSGILYFAFVLLSFARIVHGRGKKTLDYNPFRNFIAFFRDGDRRKAYILGAGVNFWWSLVYIYVPLMIVAKLDARVVGIFLSLIALPLIISEYYFGQRVGKRGYKRYFFTGYLIASIGALLSLIFFNVWFVLVVMIICSFGLAMIESTTESYFFDVVNKEEEQRFYPPYNTAIDFGNLFGRLLPSLLLFILPIRYIFIVYFVGTLFLVLLALRIRDVVECDGDKRLENKKEVEFNVTK